MGSLTPHYCLYTMNPETRFSKRLRKKFDSGHDIRVENPACPGTPDINAVVNGIEFWAETKQVKALPKRPETPVFTGVMRAEQKLWLHKRSKAGGRCCIVAYVEAEDLTYVIPGKYSYEFEGMTKAQLDEINLPLEAMWDSGTGF